MDARLLAAACPTILEGTDEMVVALCTPIVGRTPTVHILDPKAPAPLGGSLAQLELAKGSLLGGVYAYLDNRDRLVAVDGEQNLQRIAHTRDAAGRWSLHVDETIDLSSAIGDDDNVTGLSPVGKETSGSLRRPVSWVPSTAVEMQRRLTKLPALFNKLDGADNGP